MGPYIRPYIGPCLRSRVLCRSQYRAPCWVVHRDPQCPIGTLCCAIYIWPSSTPVGAQSTQRPGRHRLCCCRSPTSIVWEEAEIHVFRCVLSVFSFSFSVLLTFPVFRFMFSVLCFRFLRGRLCFLPMYHSVVFLLLCFLSVSVSCPGWGSISAPQPAPGG